MVSVSCRLNHYAWAMSAINELAQYVKCEGCLIDTPDGEAVREATCPGYNYYIFIACESYEIVCLTDVEYQCIKSKVPPGYHPIQDYIDALNQCRIDKLNLLITD